MPSRATASGERLAMLLPANAILPLRLTVPDTARSVVVLPAPFGPRTTTSSPSPTSSETPCSARIWPYRASTSSSSSRASVIRPEVGLNHRRVALHLAGRAARDPAAEVEHVHAVGDPHHQLHVMLEQRHRAEQLDVLEGACDPRADDAVRRRAQQAAPVEGDLAAVGPVEPRDQVEDRRLSRAVRPDQPDDLALADVERDAVDGNDPAEAPRQLLDRKQGHGGGLYGGRRGAG